jgi:hypothetical protein
MDCRIKSGNDGQGAFPASAKRKREKAFEHFPEFRAARHRAGHFGPDRRLNPAYKCVLCWRSAREFEPLGESRVRSMPATIIGMSLALGSYWALIPAILTILGLVWRLFDEEKFLAQNLPGYMDYCAKVRWHLMPGVF